VREHHSGGTTMKLCSVHNITRAHTNVNRWDPRPGGTSPLAEGLFVSAAALSRVSALHRPGYRRDITQSWVRLP